MVIREKLFRSLLKNFAFKMNSMRFALVISLDNLTKAANDKKKTKKLRKGKGKKTMKPQMIRANSKFRERLQEVLKWCSMKMILKREVLIGKKDEIYGGRLLVSLQLFVRNDADEFSAVLKRESNLKILITTCRFNSSRGPAFIEELLSVIPNAQYYKRGTYDLKKIIEYANKNKFTSLIVVHTNRREPDALLIIGLPNGPTAHFKLSKLVLRKDIKNHGNPTSHELELVLNNFTTRLGHRIGRLINTLFPQEPNFRGRRVVTFHNQRDFIFFRHHLYIFETKETKQAEVKGKKTKDSKADAITEAKPFARPQECGPHFTLKLISLQHGTFDPRGGEFEWVHKDFEW
ncbi:ribosome production factor 1 [Rosa chinensis]|uniref:ribosome production factor 1 n=1 Tax=Rosa chinensis TaxID=74649 RepID=UPI001AD924E3|nr:ribosome production factor 1 [Rosa chinensis]